MTSTAVSATPSRIPSISPNASTKSASGPGGAGDVALERLGQPLAVGLADGSTTTASAVSPSASGSSMAAVSMGRRRKTASPSSEGTTGIGPPPAACAAAGDAPAGRGSRRPCGRRGRRRLVPTTTGRSGTSAAKAATPVELLGREGAVRGLDDDERGEGLVVGEARGELADVRGLDAVGQERRGVVLLHLGETALERPADRRDASHTTSSSAGSSQRSGRRGRSRSGSGSARWEWVSVATTPASIST